MSAALQAVYRNKKGMFWNNSRKRMFHNDNENSEMSAPDRVPFLPTETTTQAHN